MAAAASLVRQPKPPKQSGSTTAKPIISALTSVTTIARTKSAYKTSVLLRMGLSAGTQTTGAAAKTAAGRNAIMTRPMARVSWPTLLGAERSASTHGAAAVIGVGGQTLRHQRADAAESAKRRGVVPSRLPSACTTCGRRECEHRRGKRDDRKSAARRGYDRDWRRLRAQHLNDWPLCAHCLERGRVEEATEVHHVVAIRRDPSRRLDATNLLALCRPCHARIKDE